MIAFAKKVSRRAIIATFTSILTRVKIMPADKGMGAALQYTEELLGGPVVENENTVSVATTATVIVDGRGDRVGLVIVNAGASDIIVWMSPAVSTSLGIRLTANGGSLSMDVTRDFTFPSRRWYGISTGAGAINVSTLELSRFALSK